MRQRTYDNKAMPRGQVVITNDQQTFVADFKVKAIKNTDGSIHKQCHDLSELDEFIRWNGFRMVDD